MFFKKLLNSKKSGSMVYIRRAFTFLLVLTLTFCISACGVNENDRVSAAVNELKNHWQDVYNDSKVDTDGYFEIKNTRIINIKNNTTEEFKDVDYIVEFVLYTDLFGSAPYYQIAGIDDTVVVYKNGTTEVQSNLINRYRTKHFTNDFSEFIKSIEDCGDKYNCTEKLK